MPSRRSLLAASGPAVVAPLAGCSFGSASGIRASFSNSTLRLDEASAAAKTRAEWDSCPHGAAQLTAVAYEAEPDEIVVWTRARVIPGRNRADCESGWVHRGIDMVHDLTGLRPDTEVVIAHASNVVPTDKPSPEYTLRKTGDTRRARWEIRTRQQFVAESTATYEFRSTFGPVDKVGDGDDLVDITVEFPMSSGGLFADSETVSQSTRLTYGEREE